MTGVRRPAAKLDDKVNQGNLENVMRLIEQGADVNGRNVLRDTPLIAAAHTGQPNMVRLLLVWGADKSLLGFDGKTARERAEQVGHREVLLVLGE